MFVARAHYEGNVVSSNYFLNEAMLDCLPLSNSFKFRFQAINYPEWVPNVVLKKSIPAVAIPGGIASTGENSFIGQVKDRRIMAFKIIKIRMNFADIIHNHDNKSVLEIVSEQSPALR